MFDQAGMLREVVKWDYEMKRGDQAASAVDRAMELSTASPQGPVYLSLPREVLGEVLASTSRKQTRTAERSRGTGASAQRHRNTGGLDRSGEKTADRYRHVGQGPA